MLAGCVLTEHDPEDEDCRVLPGSWHLVTCEAADALRALTADLGPWSGLTDMDGARTGTPVVFTEWGSRDGRTPVLAEARWPDPESRTVLAELGRRDARPCEHYAYRLSDA